MNRFRHFLRRTTDAFWFIPAVLVVVSVALAASLIWVEKNLPQPEWLDFIYAGGESGARSLLGAVASASIGVAGTVFSITIAALSSVVSSMGPRLLHGFLADRGIQTTLGIYVATFAFSLYSLRAVSGGGMADDEVFVPHYNVSVVMLYAAACVIFLVYYIAHMARSISMTRVVNLLADDLTTAIDAGTELAEDQAGFSRAPEGYFLAATPIAAQASGYIQYVDYGWLAKAADKQESAVELLIRPGDHVLKGSPIARVVGDMDADKINAALIIGKERSDEQDLEFNVRQLLEVGVRALSPGTNDPFTAMDVIDRFAQGLAQLHNRALPQGVMAVDDVLRVQYTVTTFEGLMDVMFHQLRQNAAGTTAVYIRMLEAFAQVATVVDIPERVNYIQHHGDLVLADAQRLVDAEADLADIQARYEQLREVTTNSTLDHAAQKQHTRRTNS
ncbi:DUF2254 domain-containing protein [Corynebacterium aquilae]|uniref:DUF2254 domain-containing protein n=1 Tax=Corynebacterium aquilae TaxID=203263 RepID=UPI00095279ED|nr:DUF2254 domain-containing protein [Corynebacterium aquilae]